ncbi:MAG TPA: ABC transporter permease [Chloroflexota bacterium]|nr:ABC transporter permease [Chloroflexota bacterium]
MSAVSVPAAAGARTTGPSAGLIRAVDLAGQWAAPVAILGVLLAAAAFVPKFYEPGNLTTVAIQSAVLGIVAVGQMLVLLVAGLDLSVNAVLGLGAVVVISNQQGFSPLTVLIALAIAVGVGLANGLLVAWRKVPPFITTFGMLIFLGGARLAYTHGQASGNVPAWLRVVGIGQIGPLPNAALAWLVILVLIGGVLQWTRYGRWIYAVGANSEAARYAGVPTREVVVACYVACSVLALVAGLVLSGYIGYVDQRLGTDFNVNSIAAAIVGGTTFTGGRGNPVGVAAGAILLSILLDLVVVAGIPINWQLAVQGVVLVLATAIQGMRGHLLSR